MRFEKEKKNKAKKVLNNFLTFDGNMQDEKENGDKKGSTNKATN